METQEYYEQKIAELTEQLRLETSRRQQIETIRAQLDEELDILAFENEKLRTELTAMKLVTTSLSYNYCSIKRLTNYTF